MATAEGVTAYADMQRRLSVSFTALWHTEDADIPEDDPDWVDVEDEEEAVSPSLGTSDGPAQH